MFANDFFSMTSVRSKSLNMCLFTKLFLFLAPLEVKKEVERLMEEEEIIRGRKKEEIVKHLECIWENQYCII